jgi:hypothetical protein
MTFTLDLPGNWKILSMTIDPGPMVEPQAGAIGAALNLVPCEHSQRKPETLTHAENLSLEMGWRTAELWELVAASRLEDLRQMTLARNEYQSMFEGAQRDALALGELLYRVAEILGNEEEPFGGMDPEKLTEAVTLLMEGNH